MSNIHNYYALKLGVAEYLELSVSQSFPMWGSSPFTWEITFLPVMDLDEYNFLHQEGGIDVGYRQGNFYCDILGRRMNTAKERLLCLPGAWNSLCMTYDGEGNYRFYINGLAGFEETLLTEEEAPAKPYQIARTFSGYVRKVAWWEECLTAQEILSDMAGKLDKAKSVALDFTGPGIELSGSLAAAVQVTGSGRIVNLVRALELGGGGWVKEAPQDPEDPASQTYGETGFFIVSHIYANISLTDRVLWTYETESGVLKLLVAGKGAKKSGVVLKAGGVGYASESLIEPQHWNTVCVGFDGKDIRFWINGTVAGTVSAPAHVPALSQAAFVIGAGSGGGDAFDGYIGYVACYDKVLSDGKINSLSSQEPYIYDAGIRALYGFYNEECVELIRRKKLIFRNHADIGLREDTVFETADGAFLYQEEGEWPVGERDKWQATVLAICIIQYIEKVTGLVPESGFRDGKIAEPFARFVCDWILPIDEAREVVLRYEGLTGAELNPLMAGIYKAGLMESLLVCLFAGVSAVKISAMLGIISALLSASKIVVTVYSGMAAAIAVLAAAAALKPLLELPPMPNPKPDPDQDPDEEEEDDKEEKHWINVKSIQFCLADMPEESSAILMERTMSGLVTGPEWDLTMTGYSQAAYIGPDIGELYIKVCFEYVGKGYSGFVRAEDSKVHPNIQDNVQESWSGRCFIGDIPQFEVSFPEDGEYTVTVKLAAAIRSDLPLGRFSEVLGWTAERITGPLGYSRHQTYLLPCRPADPWITEGNRAGGHMSVGFVNLYGDIMEYNDKGAVASKEGCAAYLIEAFFRLGRFSYQGLGRTAYSKWSGTYRQPLFDRDGFDEAYLSGGRMDVSSADMANLFTAVFAVFGYSVRLMALTSGIGATKYEEEWIPIRLAFDNVRVIGSDNDTELEEVVHFVAAEIRGEDYLTDNPDEQFTSYHPSLVYDASLRLEHRYAAGLAFGDDLMEFPVHEEGKDNYRDLFGKEYYDIAIHRIYEELAFERDTEGCPMAEDQFLGGDVFAIQYGPPAIGYRLGGPVPSFAPSVRAFVPVGVGQHRCHYISRQRIGEIMVAFLNQAGATDVTVRNAFENLRRALYCNVDYSMFPAPLGRYYNWATTWIGMITPATFTIPSLVNKGSRLYRHFNNCACNLRAGNSTWNISIQVNYDPEDWVYYDGGNVTAGGTAGAPVLIPGAAYFASIGKPGPAGAGFYFMNDNDSLRMVYLRSVQGLVPQSCSCQLRQNVMGNRIMASSNNAPALTPATYGTVIGPVPPVLPGVRQAYYWMAGVGWVGFVV